MDVFFPLANWDFLLVATSEGNPTHRPIVPKTIPNETLPPTSRTSGCRAPGCKPSPRYRSRFEIPSGSLVFLMLIRFPDAVSFLRSKRTLSHRMHHCRHCTFGFFFDFYDRFCRRSCICLFFGWILASQEVRPVHVLESSFDVVELLVKSPRTVSCQFFLLLTPIFT